VQHFGALQSHLRGTRLVATGEPSPGMFVVLKGVLAGGLSGRDHQLSGQFVVDQSHVLDRHGGSLSGLAFSRFAAECHSRSELEYVCVDSTGARAADTKKPVARCDRPQRLLSEFDDPGPLIPPTLSKTESEPFERLHPKLRVSPLQCRAEEITYCEGMVRLSCGADRDLPVTYNDNTTAELLGTCGFWVRDPKCMPQRWKACAVKNGVRSIAEEPDPSR
jgi:hypothetical protein